MIQTRAVDGKNGGMVSESSGNKSNAATKKSNVNKSIKRYIIGIIFAVDCIQKFDRSCLIEYHCIFHCWLFNIFYLFM